MTKLITENDLKGILDEAGVIAYEKEIGRGTTYVNITSYTSSSNMYTCPSDGEIQLLLTYRASNYIILYNSNGNVVCELSTSNANNQGNEVFTYPVFKGEKYYITQTSGNYCTAYFIPYVKTYKMPNNYYEYGTDNSWEYRKYPDGTYDAWRYYQASSMTITTSNGGIYYGGEKQLTLPSFNKTTGIICTYGDAPSHYSGVYTYQVEISNITTLKIYYRSHASASNASCGTYLYIHGSWE